MHINLSEQSSSEVYFTLIQTLIPRPIAWVLTDNGSDTFNLAPFSFFNALCSDPALVMISVGKKPDGSQKDTRINIEARNEFIIHIASSKQLAALNQSSITLPHGISELDALDLELETIDGFRLPRISHCPVAYLCERYEIQEMGRSQQSIIIGEVKSVYIDDSISEINQKNRLIVNAAKMDPLIRLGTDEFTQLGEIQKLERPL